jgi:hypothetical protein
MSYQTITVDSFCAPAKPSEDLFDTSAQVRTISGVDQRPLEIRNIDHLASMDLPTLGTEELALRKLDESKGDQPDVYRWALLSRGRDDGAEWVLEHLVNLHGGVVGKKVVSRLCKAGSSQIPVGHEASIGTAPVGGLQHGVETAFETLGLIGGDEPTRNIVGSLWWYSEALRQVLGGKEVEAFLGKPRKDLLRPDVRCHAASLCRYWRHSPVSAFRIRQNGSEKRNAGHELQ